MSNGLLAQKAGNPLVPIRVTSVSAAGSDVGSMQIVDPSSPFGSVESESLWALFQNDPVYGINTEQLLSDTTGTGTVTASDSSYVCSTGVTVGSGARLQSRNRARHRAGQGLTTRFGALFDTPVANSVQAVGVGSGEDGAFFSYRSSSEFSVIYTARGVLEAQVLTVTAAASAAETVTITLDGIVQPGVVISVGGTVNRTAYELSQATYEQWKTVAVNGNTVVFLKVFAVPNVGGYSAAGDATFVGSFAQAQVGASSTRVQVPQSSWNVDKCDGTGPSGFTLNPQSYNIYQIQLQNLGGGTLTYMLQTVDPANVPHDHAWQRVHVVHNQGNLNTLFGNPSLPFVMNAQSIGSTTDVVTKCAGFGGFLNGNKKFTGNRFALQNDITSAADTNFQAIFTVLNHLTYNGRTSQVVIRIQEVTAALKHNFPANLYLIRSQPDGKIALGGSPNFMPVSGTGVYMDTSATTVTPTTDSQIKWIGSLSDTGNLSHTFDDIRESIDIQAGEYLTVACKTTSGTATRIVGGLVLREDS